MSSPAYSPNLFEKKWQDQWLTDGMYQADDASERPKSYILVEFPYPSGEGLHVGHCLSYIAQDIVARHHRMKGDNVLYPIGWDAFGLPTENYAIKNKIKPQVATAQNVSNFKRQIRSLGISFDWSREINTTDPGYYKWTQWIFLKLFKAGLAEKKEMPINWCPSCKIGLAFEEVVNGSCERCGTVVTRRNIKQWVLKITKYADRLIDDLERVDFLPEIKQQQINWIGRSEGAEIDFNIKDTDTEFTVFTTRPDTLFGATYCVLAPEHPLLAEGVLPIANRKEVEEYIAAARHKTDRERQENREKTGVELKGIKAINPANHEEIPVWVADYVLMGYGTGAIMAVPAHDERDKEFAEKFGVPMLQVIDGESDAHGMVYEGRLIHSGKFDGMLSDEAREKIPAHVGGRSKVQYKLRDWIFSRQHYWGEPIPIIHCEKCGAVPVPDEDLPVVLPDVQYYEPTDTGESPLAKITDWVNVTCPKCGGAAKRETDTMPNWAGSSWYFLRYCDPHNEKLLADPAKLTHWLPVDLYNGGAEHTTLHLLYSRFWHKFLYDIGVVPTAEPYQRRVQHGMILAPDGQKMSKSRGNVINPDEIVTRYGADVFRLYMMFMGEYDQYKSWNDDNMQGVQRFLQRVWKHFSSLNIVASDSDIQQERAKALAVQGVTADIEHRSFNTAVSKLMIFWNEIADVKLDRDTAETFLKLLAPFAPHITEELWHEVCGYTTSIHEETWPVLDQGLITIIRNIGVAVGIQINGKVRAEFTVTPDMTEADIRTAVLALPQVQKYVPNIADIKKFIYVPSRMISIVV